MSDSTLQRIWDKCRQIETSETATSQAKAVARTIRDLAEEDNDEVS